MEPENIQVLVRQEIFEMKVSAVWRMQVTSRLSAEVETTSPKRCEKQRVPAAGRVQEEEKNPPRKERGRHWLAFSIISIYSNERLVQWYNGRIDFRY